MGCLLLALKIHSLYVIMIGAIPFLETKFSVKGMSEDEKLREIEKHGIRKFKMSSTIKTV